MLTVMKNSWALLLGMFLLMLGNGLHGTLLGVRGAIEGYSALELSLIMSGYSVGFLGGSRMAPEMIRRVGHVRVFAALASLVSACLILFAAVPNPYFWILLRIILGFCFSGVYVVAESWLNDSASNENRGQTMSAYLIVQMVGIVVAQMVLNLADPSGFILFVLMSVLVSVSFAPILLSVSPAPVFHTTQPMSLKNLYQVSPLGFVGSFLLGFVFSALFGMSAVFATGKGMSIGDISIFVSAIYVGGMVLQYPIGWISDRMDRRTLIAELTIFGAVFMFLGMSFADNFYVLILMAFVVGGISNPLYSLYIAYTNDFLEYEDMAAASGGLIFIHGVGAISGPLIVGWMMSRFGYDSYFAYMGILLALMGGYAVFRMTQRSAPRVGDTSSYAPVAPTGSLVAVEVAQEIAIEMAQEEENDELS